MEHFDVIIVGGGPAGLKCAETLSFSGLEVLLVEKNQKLGKKVCAGGLTRRSITALPVPPELVECAVYRTELCTPRRHSVSLSEEPLAFMINRTELGEWQYEKIDAPNIHFIMGVGVTSVKEKHVILSDGTEYSYDYLVGADGFNSIVRKYLGFPQDRKLIGIQYRIARKMEGEALLFHFNPRFFKAWYTWTFPHRDSHVIGCCADPAIMPVRQLKDNFHRWLAEKGVDLKNAEFESAPISFDYRGFRFGNIFLAGEAGGFASGLNGEGIYQATVSGEAAARLILNQDAALPDLKRMMRYNRIQKRILNFLLFAGPLRKPVFELIVMMYGIRSLQKQTNRLFT
ncbi:MAG: NAD(P)/FAD-dependent oxidoreductase [Bacteroidales bacterium]|nr:NAD(P)/FAD-dependent oxidoreductase [Bacteroidales bacterium]MBN2697635.1 NAD(P)/FAD-dependent oxidoreductase [Bacteroidales bacterium]